MTNLQYDPFNRDHGVEAPWRDERYEYNTDGLMIYMGRSLTPNASTSTGSLWFVWKFSYEVSLRLTRRQRDNGNWDDRTSLNWG